jgi:flagellar protein FliL
MAEADKKLDEEGDVHEGQGEKKPLPLKMIIISVLALCLIGGGFFAWKSGMFSKKSGEETAVAEKATEEKGEAVSIGVIFEMDDFVVNLSGGSGNNYLKAKINLELGSEEAKAEAEKRVTQFRDSIITLLSGKTYEEVTTLEGKAQMKVEIMTILNELLKTGKVTNVYFSDFIVQ